MPPTEKPVGDLAAVTDMPITKVRESKANPRKISERAVELVGLSLTRFGWKQPLVVDSDGIIIVGHTRYRAALSLGLDRVPVVVADDLTPAEVDAYRIADNRTRDFTTWDLPMLAEQLDGLSDGFADVLALADWEAIVSDYAEAGAVAATETSIDLPDGVGNALDGGFTITAHFHTKEDASAAEALLIDMPGAFDVRHNR